MKKPGSGRSNPKRSKAAPKGKGGPEYVLRLYIAGTSARSNQAITNIRRICDEQLKGRCDLEVIDIYQQPILAAGAQIIAVPTLIKKLPPPLRRFIGSMADVDRILFGLDLKPRKDDVI